MWIVMNPASSRLAIIGIFHIFVAAPGVEGAAGEMQRIRVADDHRSFALAESGEKFIPWGFNYDHDESGRLIEDYWDDAWLKIEEDFREMKQLGANVVRIHLQTGKFMQSPEEANQHSLAQLARLLKLAEETELYLDLTGLACYHKQDTPPWFDALSESDRWDVQARFWEAIARTCRDSPAVFCYDLMNEPVVAAGRRPDNDWLGPAFGDKHFVQYVALDLAGRERPDVAKAWIGRLVPAIRKHDPQRLVTVGLVPWSLDRPGLTSGFVPEKIAGELDFIAVHIYPENGKLDDSLETLRGFAIGKPVLVEETFPLKCSPEEFTQFVEKSREHAAGWIGFYWGATPEELKPPKGISEALTLSWLEIFQKHDPNKTK
jgi:hypothetical protein